jgi:hypothetical protein
VRIRELIAEQKALPSGLDPLGVLPLRNQHYRKDYKVAGNSGNEFLVAIRSYWLDEKELESGNCREIIQGSIASFLVEDRDGEFIIPVTDERYGDALFNFVQAISKVSDVSFLTRERVRSTFLEDLKSFLQSHVPPDRLSFDWTDPGGRDTPSSVRAFLPAKPRLKNPNPQTTRPTDQPLRGPFARRLRIHPAELRRNAGLRRSQIAIRLANSDSPGSLDFPDTRSV